MKYVIDTSVAFKWAIAETDSDKAILLINRPTSNPSSTPTPFPVRTISPLAVSNGKQGDSVKELNGTLVSFQKRDLAHLNYGQLKILCVFPHIMNRLKVLETQIYSHANVVQDESNDEAIRDVAICGFLESIILMAGELKEAYEAIQECYYNTKLAKAMSPLLPTDIQERLKRLQRHFSGDSLIHFLRNHFAYHNSPSTVLDAIKSLDDDTPMAFYFLGQGTNIYYKFATNIRIGALANRLGIDDWHEAVSGLMPEIMGKIFNDVYLPMLVLVRDILVTFKQEITPVRLNSVPRESELRASVFYHSDN